jgi:thiol-disulfide isomerase/thioredoxin
MRSLFVLLLFINLNCFGSPGTHTYKLKDLSTLKTLLWTPKSVVKPTIVFFWTSWCTYCKEALSHLSESMISHFDVVSISCDEDIKKAFKAGNSEFKAYRPLYWLDKKENSDQFVSSYPTLLIVMPGGRIDTIYEGSQGDKMSYFTNRLRYLMNLSL